MRKTTNLKSVRLPVAQEYNPATNKGNWDRNRTAIKKIVIHTIVGNIQGATAKFSNPDRRSSAHYGIGLDGTIYQWVDEDFVAYHASKYSVNQESIGIEHEDGYNPTTNPNAYNEERPDVLYRTSAKLVRDICEHYKLPVNSETVVRHRDVAATACPDSLDVERIIREANEASLEENVPEIAGLDEHEFRALKFLRENYPLLRTIEGEAYGNIEGAVRDMTDIQKTYTNLMRNTDNGQPPVVVPSKVFLDISIKAKHLDTIADLLDYPQDIRSDPQFSNVIVNHILELYTKIEANGANGGIVKNSTVNNLENPDISTLTNEVPNNSPTDNSTIVSPKTTTLYEFFGAISNFVRLFTKNV